MYCVKCGCRLQPADKICPDCGNEIRESEYCSGFWDLAEKREALQPEEKVNETEITEDSTEDSTEECLPTEEKPEKNGRKKRCLAYGIFMVLIVLLLAVCMLQTVRYKQKNEAYEEYREKYEEVTQDYQDQVAAYKKLQKKMAGDKRESEVDESEVDEREVDESEVDVSEAKMAIQAETLDETDDGKIHTVQKNNEIEEGETENDGK